MPNLATPQEALLDDETRLHAVVERGLAGIAQLDLQGRFLCANARLCELLGRRADALRGMPNS